MKPHRIVVEKTARYFTLGTPGAKVEHVLFVCHGYAQLANEFLADFERLEREDLLLVAPEGLHRFYARGGAGNVAASWMTKEDRDDDIRDYVQYLDNVHAEVRREILPDAKISVLGFSQGAATASRWAAMGNSKIDALILFCGFFPPDLSPAGIPKALQMTVVTASNDKYVSPEQEKEQLETMRKISPGLQHVQFEGAHEVNVDVVEQLLHA